MPIYSVLVTSRTGEPKKVSFPMDEETYNVISTQDPSERIKYFTEEYHDYNHSLWLEKNEKSLDVLIEELGDYLPALKIEEDLDPAREYERKQTDSLVDDALVSLNPRYREILLLSKDGGGSLSKADIARRFSLDRSTVSKIVTSAKKKVKEFLESKEFDYHG